MAPPINSSAMMNQRKRANMVCSLPAPASAAGRPMNSSSETSRARPSEVRAGRSTARLCGCGTPGIAHQDLLMRAGDVRVEGHRGLRQIGFGPLLRLEIAEFVHAAHERSAVMRSDDLSDIGRQVTDGEADPALTRRVWIGAVDQPYMVQRHLAWPQLQQAVARLIHVDRDFLAARQQVA